MSSVMIEAEGLAKRYGPTVALDGIDLQVPAGVMCAGGSRAASLYAADLRVYNAKDHRWKRRRSGGDAPVQHLEAADGKTGDLTKQHVHPAPATANARLARQRQAPQRPHRRSDDPGSTSACCTRT